MSTYYGFNQIDLNNLTYEEFREKALDLPKSLSEDYKKVYSMAESMSSPYADGLGGWNQGSNFMPQLLRELMVKEEDEKTSLHKKLTSFYEKLKNEEIVHPKLQFELQCWGEHLIRI